MIFTNKNEDIYKNGEWWCSAKTTHCAENITKTLNKANEQCTELHEENIKLLKENLKIERIKHQNKENIDLLLKTITTLNKKIEKQQKIIEENKT